MIKSFVDPLQSLSTRDDPSLAEQFPLYSTALFDSNVGMGMIPIRLSWPDSLIRRIATAFVANNLGIGMDYALKKYGERQNTLNRMVIV